jgi:hypothetical protein
VTNNNITLAEWLERIKQHIVCLGATIMHLLGGWTSLTNEEKQKQIESMLAEMRTIATMIQNRHLFNGNDKPGD